jgi:polysaccharide biosynthesis protein PslH
LNVLFLSTWFPHPPDNGSKIRANYLVQALSRRHKVVLAAFDRERRQDEAGAWERRDVFNDVEAIAVLVDPFRYAKAPQLVKFLSPIPLPCWPSRVMRRVVDLLAAKSHYDIVIAFQEPVAPYALAAGKIPRVLDIDVSLGYQRYLAWLDAPSAAQRLRHWVGWHKRRRYEWRLIKRFDACTLVAPGELEFVRQAFQGTGAQFHLSENGVDCSHNYPGVAPKIPGSLVYNGALTYSANYDAMRWFLGDLYPAIRKQVPGVSLTITGSTTGVNLTALALDESVRLSGYVDDIRFPVAAASVCVVPIRQGGGTRLKILEAMALGTPVVATSKGAEGLNITPEHDFLIADEPADFARQVVRLLREPKLGEHLARNARHLVEERYDWTQIGHRFVDLVEGVVERRGLA